ncbi:hypothetical protein V6N13_137570 [Hibiscus sabdariffa]
MDPGHLVPETFLAIDVREQYTLTRGEPSWDDKLWFVPAGGKHQRKKNEAWKLASQPLVSEAETNCRYSSQSVQMDINSYLHFSHSSS